MMLQFIAAIIVLGGFLFGGVLLFVLGNRRKIYRILLRYERYAKEAAGYDPGHVADFICQLYAELDINNKALFKAVFYDFFLDTTPNTNDEKKSGN